MVSNMPATHLPISLDIKLLQSLDFNISLLIHFQLSPVCKANKIRKIKKSKLFNQLTVANFKWKSGFFFFSFHLHWMMEMFSLCLVMQMKQSLFLYFPAQTLKGRKCICVQKMYLHPTKPYRLGLPKQCHHLRSEYSCA